VVTKACWPSFGSESCPELGQSQDHSSKFVLAAILRSQNDPCLDRGAKFPFWILFLKEHSEKIPAGEKFPTGYSDLGSAFPGDG
jgi:hypothetical protein